MTLGRRERDVVAWALDAMRDYAEDPDCDYSAEDLPTLVGADLELGSASSTEDLLYRLEEQLASMNEAARLPRRPPRLARGLPIGLRGRL